MVDPMGRFGATSARHLHDPNISALRRKWVGSTI
jgi:hypothetical protein